MLAQPCRPRAAPRCGVGRRHPAKLSGSSRAAANADRARARAAANADRAWARAGDAWSFRTTFCAAGRRRTRPMGSVVSKGAFAQRHTSFRSLLGSTLDGRATCSLTRARRSERGDSEARLPDRKRTTIVPEAAQRDARHPSFAGTDVHADGDGLHGDLSLRTTDDSILSDVGQRSCIHARACGCSGAMPEAEIRPCARSPIPAERRIFPTCATA